LLSAWAFRSADLGVHPANERDGARLKFKAPIPADRFERIEDI
jgi:hypothetical protein